MNLYKSGISPDTISLQLDIELKEINKILQNIVIEEDRKRISKKLAFEAPSLSSIHLEAVVDLNSAIQRAQSRVWKALDSKPEFNISFKRTQIILEK